MNPTDQHGNLHAWIRMVTGNLILIVFYVGAQLVLRDNAALQQSHMLRKLNETLAAAVLTDEELKASRSVPGVSTVQAVDLANAYREMPQTADYAYTNKKVRVQLRQYVVRGNTVHWHLGDPTLPPVVEMEFTEPVGNPRGTIWIEGICIGPAHDGDKRDIPGYDFHVSVVDCRLTTK